MSLDVEGLRADTPACETLLHFNNAGAGLMPRPVLESLTAHLTREATVGGYEAAALAKDQLENFYRAAARAVGGQPHEIAYVENATRGWDMVFYAFDWQPGDAVLTPMSEYNSNMIAYRHLEARKGIEVRLVPDDAAGAIDVAALEAMIDDRAKLIALTHIPTNGGLVNPAKEVGAVARRHGIPYLLDACQSVGQMPIDVHDIGCTMLSTTGRKYIRGPRGTGFLWVAEDWIGRLDPPFLDNHAARWTGVETMRVVDDAKRFENWESYIAGRIALGVALDYMQHAGMAETWMRIQDLAATLRSALSDVPGVDVHDRGHVKCGIATFTVAGRATAEICDALRLERINTSASDVQLTRDDLLERDIHAMVRASVHAYNTADEIDRFVETLKKIIS